MEGEKTVPEIAKEAGLSPRTVCRLKTDPEFISRQEKMEKAVVEDIKKILTHHGKRAAEKIAKLAGSGKPEQRIQLDAAKEILHQLGVKPIEVIETRQREYSAEELVSAAKVAKELEDLLGRLSTTPSPFLVKREQASSPLLPVTAANSEPVKEEPVKLEEDKVE